MTRNVLKAVRASSMDCFTFYRKATFSQSRTHGGVSVFLAVLGSGTPKFIQKEENNTQHVFK
jgi:hypothetical protein